LFVIILDYFGIIVSRLIISFRWVAISNKFYAYVVHVPAFDVDVIIMGASYDSRIQWENNIAKVFC